MDGLRFRRGLSGDIPFFAGVVLATGAVLGAVAAVVVDWTIHRHRGKL